MHPSISAFPSRLFYESRLVDGPDLADVRAAEWHSHELLTPYRFFNVSKGAERKKQGGKSLWNSQEVEAVVSIIHTLCTTYPHIDVIFCTNTQFAHRIGIITPYKLQFLKIKDRLVELGGDRVLKTIDLNTVDGFQGQEKDIVILSCVRGGVQRGVGFLGDVRRMNVGLTRARRSLFVVGNAGALKKNSEWLQFVEDADDRGFMTDWTHDGGSIDSFPGNLFGTVESKRARLE